MSTSSEARLLNIKQAAAYLGIGVTTMKVLRNTGEVPAVKIRDAVRFDPKDLEKFIERRKRAR